MRKLFNAWQSLGIFGKLLIVAIPIALILFSSICMDTNWDEFITTEQDYIALEQVAYEIIETQNVMQPLRGNLKHYTIEFADDGTIEIVLYGNAESLHFTVTEDFEVKSFYRGISDVVPTVIIVSLVCVLMGLFGAIIIYDAADGIRRIYFYFKN